MLGTALGTAAAEPSETGTRQAAQAAAAAEVQAAAEAQAAAVAQATALLRTGIREGAQTTEESRILAKKKAHSLLGKASKTLSQAIEDGASTLQDFIKKM